MSEKSSFPIWAIGLIAALALAVGWQSWQLHNLSATIEATQPNSAQAQQGIAYARPQLASASQPRLSQPSVVNQAPSINKVAPAQPGQNAAPTQALSAQNPFPRLGSGQWDPFAEMQRMREEMDALFNQTMTQGGGSPHFGNVFTQHLAMGPQIKVNESPNSYDVTIDMKGDPQGNIDAQINGQTLTISATIESNNESQNGNAGVYSHSSSVSKFTRSFPLDQPVDPNSLSTIYKDGLIHIKINKA